MDRVESKAMEQCHLCDPRRPVPTLGGNVSSHNRNSLEHAKLMARHAVSFQG
jgi:hypothetical protein